MFLTLLFLLGLLYAHLRWSTKCTKVPPRYSGYLPIIGHAHLLLGDRFDLWRTVRNIGENCTKMGGLMTFSLGPYWNGYCISDPDDFFTVATTCLKKDAFYDLAKPWLGEGLLTGSVPIWKVRRKLISRAFTQPVLDEYLRVFNSQSKKLVEDMEKEVGGPPFDQSRYIEANTLETVYLTAMGFNHNEDEIHEKEQYLSSLRKLVNVLIQRAQKVWLHLDIIYHWTELKKKQDRLIRVLHDISHLVLKRKREKLKNAKNESEGKYNSFMDILLQDSTLTDDEIREEVDTMIAAGFDTTSNLLIYIMLMLGSRPEVQDKVYKEIQEVFNHSERDMEKHDLAKLVYLEAVIKETLRLYPIGPLIGRQTDGDVKLKNFTLPSGSRCFLLIYSMHRHPIWGPDAYEFKPDRWLSPTTLPDNLNAFAGFSLGRRGCVGQKFGMMSMKTTLARVLRSYRITGDDTNLQLRFDLIIRAVSGHHISIERRSD